MIRPLIAIGALVILAAVADASYRHDSYEDNKYDHDYKHEPQYYKEKYHEPTYVKYDDEYGYEVPKYDHRPMYKTRYGYDGDSYGKSYSSYEDDHYGDDSYDHSYRHKRATESVFESLMEPELSVEELAAFDESRVGLEATRQGLCVTRSGAQCKFPFKNNGGTFNSCAISKKYGKWCATSLWSNGNVKSWSKCINC